MSKKTLWVASLSVFLMLALGFYVGAQMKGGGQKMGQMGQKGPMPGMMMGGGGSSMVVHGNYIYVFSSNTLFKINPSAMKVEQELVLKPKMGPGGPKSRPEEEPSFDE